MDLGDSLGPLERHLIERVAQMSNQYPRLSYRHLREIPSSIVRLIDVTIGEAASLHHQAVWECASGVRVG